MYQSGVKAIIIVYRQDTYGTGLSNATGAYFKKFGGTVVDSISYDATAADKGALDFSPILQKMSSDWTSASATYGANHTAFFLVTFEEMVKLLAQAKANFPSLLSTPQPWYQMDGTAQDSVVIGNSTSGPLMAQIRSPATLYAPFNSTKLVAFCHAFSMGFHNEPCDAYAQGGYDDTWLAALSILAAGVNSGAAIQANMLTVANNFYGVTGWNALQPSGDRSPINGYDIWKVVLVGSTPTWVLAGHWDPVADAVTWTSKP
jgi:ABC-type branched-subunit amino acid transport system substrate-binding protein